MATHQVNIRAFTGYTTHVGEIAVIALDESGFLETKSIIETE